MRMVGIPPRAEAAETHRASHRGVWWGVAVTAVWPDCCMGSAGPSFQISGESAKSTAKWTVESLGF